MGTESDDDMIPEDLWSIKRFSEIGAKLTGYPCDQHLARLQVPPQGRHQRHAGLGLRAPRRAVLGGRDLGAEQVEAGITDYKWIDWYREHPVEDDLKLIKWSDEHTGGKAHVDWKPFMHPQLGAVEIGGWDKMNYWRNPPPEAARARGRALSEMDDDDRAVAAQARAAAHRGARARPRHLARAHRGGQQRLAAGLHHAARAQARKVVRGVIFEIHLPEADRSVSLVSGKPRMEGPQLEGHAPKNSLNAFLPNTRRSPRTAPSTSGSCVRRKGTRLALSARADRAGAVRAEVDPRLSVDRL